MGDASDDRSQGPTARARRVVFIHIPKTGGTTLKQVLSANAPRAARLANVFKGGGGRVREPDYERMVGRMRADVRAEFFWGHTPVAVASYMPPDWVTNFITFLRDPVERAISQYYGMVDRLRVRDARVGDGQRAGNTSRGARRKRRLIRGEFSLDVPYEIALADAAYVSDNLQTRMLSGLPRPFDEVTDAMLERAIENLGRFTCIGLTERFDESLVLLKRRIGYHKILYDHQRVNTSRPRDAGVPDELRRAAERANQFDRELYRQAAIMFDRAPELGDVEFQIDLCAVRSSRADVEAPLPDPPPELGPDGPWWPELLAERRAALGTPRARGRKRLRARDPEVVRTATLRRAERPRGPDNDRRVADRADGSHPPHAGRRSPILQPND